MNIQNKKDIMIVILLIIPIFIIMLSILGIIIGINEKDDIILIFLGILIPLSFLSSYLFAISLIFKNYN